MVSVTYTPIGIIHTPFTELRGMPLQSVAAQGVTGYIDLAVEYQDGLQDIEGFSHLLLIYHLHLSQGHKLRAMPFLDDQPRGIFATRAPKRPNPIGLSIVRLVGIENSRLLIEDVDILDGTPLLDIKPYVPLFDDRMNARIGWFKTNIERVFSVRADERFVPK
ncbi:MAG: tRNA (N6-threonylcarbamoyladenosine(37)-N6)-methyltransferase TrmO [Anaerolineae bacterium]